MNRLVSKALLVPMGILSLTACSLFAPADRIRVERLSNEYAPAKANAGDIQIYFEEIKQLYVSIARITGQGLAGGSITGLLEELRQKAAELGADALVNVKTGQRLVTTSGYSQGLQQDYGLPTNREQPVNEIVNGQQIPWATAIAVKFKKEEKGE